ncbi:hypothetical protein B5M09_013867 [Aphanomyces astaci]|uniref:Uncharacterized protein n=1 Tax=Aphanomyces astaci TaxID=112090 RepID=A0A3R7WBZ8_APHAT|nr:hypothetical protein B5M09_013867 [Aphanomyces astaci]
MGEHLEKAEAEVERLEKTVAKVERLEKTVAEVERLQKVVAIGERLAKVKVCELFQQHSLPDVEFKAALKEPLGFKISTMNPEYVSKWPNSFTEGQAEYGPAIDVFIEHRLLSTTATAVAALDAMWFTLVVRLGGCAVLQDKTHGASSRPGTRPDAIFLKHDVLVGTCETKAYQKDLCIATKELAEKMADDAFRVFPKGMTSIPAWATSSTSIELHQLSYLPAAKTYTTTLLKCYDVSNFDGRHKFVVDVFKVLKWVCAIQKPNMLMHLFPQVRTKTSNGHYVTWLKEGLVKEFGEGAAIDMAVVERIYNAPLEHVERGRRSGTSVTITSIGQRLQSALGEFQGKRDLIIHQVKQALEELQLGSWTNISLKGLRTSWPVCS